MGAYAPAPIIDEEMAERIETEIVIPTLEAMKFEGYSYNGCLYCGLMITKEGPKVVEYNCRFGDPETQVVLPLLKGDLLELLYSASIGNIDKYSVDYLGGSAVCVVAASKGYPGKYEKGKEIYIPEHDMDENVIVFHAGTKRENSKLVTSGGRVLNVTAVSDSDDLTETKKIAYKALNKINFEGIYFRKDIADKGIKRQSKAT
jgi:phosphoribosylamine--glycine ligase